MKKAIENCEDNEIPKLSGGDAKVAQAIHGERYDIKMVKEDEEPGLGMVWYKKGSDGSLELYKHNYATK
jgi:hypothetical protein